MSGRFNVSRCVFLLTALAACTLGFSTSVHASAEEEGDHSHHNHAGDLLFFPDITGTHDSISVPGLKQNELMPEVDIFYSTEHERLRFLAEFLLSRDEHDMERLQVGWLAHPTTTLWIGRFHNPLGFWNSAHHHGAFMQTTISRPGIIAFEDDGGVLPTHVSGLLAEGTLDREGGDVNYAFGIGKGPELASGLEPVNILELRNGGKLAVSARLSYRPPDESVGEFGGFAGYTRIPVAGAAFDEADQTVAGIFYNVETERFRLIGEMFRVNNRLKGMSMADDADFTAGYVQSEYQVHTGWTIYGRLEGTGGTKNNPYLDLIPDFLKARAMAGSRVGVGRNQALKLEISRNKRQDDAQFSQISLQWSMVYP
jgi:hypothetical protein